MSKNRRFQCICMSGDDEGYDLPLAKESVGNGWHGILERVWLAKPTTAKVIQVKEKFGGLRVYIEGLFRVDIQVPDGVLSGEFGGPLSGDLDAFRGVIRAAETESRITCEDCGGLGELRTGRWALVPRVSINPPMDVAFSAWLIEIADTTWVTGVERFRPVADSIKADLSRMKVEAVRVEPQLDVCD